MPDSKDNEKKLRNAGLRMALKLIPKELLDQAPATLEKFLLGQLTDVEPMHNESGTCYILAPDNSTGALRLMLCTLDEESRVSRIIKQQSLSELFNQILDGLKEL